MLGINALTKEISLVRLLKKLLRSGKVIEKLGKLLICREVINFTIIDQCISFGTG